MKKTEIKGLLDKIDDFYKFLCRFSSSYFTKINKSIPLYYNIIKQTVSYTFLIYLASTSKTLIHHCVWLISPACHQLLDMLMDRLRQWLVRTASGCSKSVNFNKINGLKLSLRLTFVHVNACWRQWPLQGPFLIILKNKQFLSVVSKLDHIWVAIKQLFYMYNYAVMYAGLWSIAFPCDNFQSHQTCCKTSSGPELG